MFGKQNGRHHRHGRRSAVPGTRGLRARLSYANVTASLALFVALGGTAVAAVTLPRDSVGSRQIRTDAVRSPEIAKDAVRSPEITRDAVRSPEIRAEAVRTSEIEDKGVRLADISDSARSALQGAQGPTGPQGPSGATSVRIAEADSVTVPTCDSLTACQSLALLAGLPPGNWLVQAKFTVVGTNFGLADRCGLVQGVLEETVLDEATSIGLNVDTGSEAVTLVGVATTGVTTGSIALRCTEASGAFLTVRDVKLTALEVANVVGP
jgi:hypothetical protein